MRVRSGIYQLVQISSSVCQLSGWYSLELCCMIELAGASKIGMYLLSSRCMHQLSDGCELDLVCIQCLAGTLDLAGIASKIWHVTAVWPLDQACSGCVACLIRHVLDVQQAQGRSSRYQLSGKCKVDPAGIGCLTSVRQIQQVLAVQQMYGRSSRYKLSGKCQVDPTGISFLANVWQSQQVSAAQQVQLLSSMYQLSGRCILNKIIIVKCQIQQVLAVQQMQVRQGINENVSSSISCPAGTVQIQHV